MNIHMNIGPLRWDIISNDEISDVCSRPGYRAFVAATAQPASSVMKVKIIRKTGSRPNTDPLFSSGENWAMWHEAGRRIICTQNTQRVPGRVLLLNPSLDEAELYLGPEAETSIDQAIGYPLDQIMTWGLLSRCGGLLVHAAAVVKDGRANVLIGRSGAGKSTLAAWCHAKGYRVLNDDRILLYNTNGTWMAAGTPWHGSGRFAENAAFPVERILRLTKDGCDRIESMSEPAAVRDLLVTASIPWFEDVWADRTLDSIHRLVRDIKVEQFYCTNSSSAVRCLEQQAVQSEVVV